MPTVPFSFGREISRKFVFPQALRGGEYGADASFLRVVEGIDIVEVRLLSVGCLHELVDDANEPVRGLTGAHGHPELFEEPCWCSESR